MNSPVYYYLMAPRNPHIANAAKEKRWIADAARDAANLNAEGSRLWAQGRHAEAQFDFEEARNAESWVNKRRAILHREERLSRR